MKTKGTILIVDDELSMREFLSILLEKDWLRHPRRRQRQGRPAIAC